MKFDCSIVILNSFKYYHKKHSYNNYIRCILKKNQLALLQVKM